MPNKTIRGRRALGALSAAAIGAAMLPRLAGTGMHVDGVTYATLARNLAAAPNPNLWRLHYTDTLHSAFYEHPPAGIWLLAATFRAVGDVPWAETLHAALLTVALFVGLAALWRSARPDPTVGAWLPVAVLLSFPLTSWVFSNGMLEGPMTVACVLAATATLRGWASHDRRKAFAWGGVAGAATAAGVLIKGPFALFLLVLPALAPILKPATAPRQSEWTTAGMAAMLLAVGGVLFAHPEAHAYLARYGEQQLWNSLRGGREIASSRLTALRRLFGELAVGTVGALGMQMVARRWARQPLPAGLPGPARGWALLGLSGSLPVLLSPKQSGWYIAQSLPFFGLALACWVSPAATWVQKQAGQHASRVRAVAMALALISLGIATGRWGHVDKHADFHAAFTRQPLAPMPQAHWTVCPLDLLHDWGLHANVARRAHASLTAQPGPWLLVDTKAMPCAVPPTCVPFHPPAPERYRLYHCSEQAPGRS